MKWFDRIFRNGGVGMTRKSVPSTAVVGQAETKVEERRVTRIETIEAQIRMNRLYESVDGIAAFNDLPEVFFPIDFIASRVAGAHFEIRKNSDDSIVWCNNRTKNSEALSLARLIDKPNWAQSWHEFVYHHLVQKLATGNGFIRAAMNSDIFGPNTEKWKWCKALWSVPSSLMEIDVNKYGSHVDLFGCEDIDDVINGYRLDGRIIIPSWQIFHDRDLSADLGDSNAEFLWSASRLFATKKNISILKRVYDARNTIYDKCGALGIITNRASDETGHVAMTENEKKELHDHYNASYGPQSGKSSTLITDANVDYLKTGANIAELMPFDETLADAIEIAGIYKIPAVLVPRKDQSTFSNQATAEKAVYTSVIIPMCQKFCQELTLFLGLKDHYLWCNFDDVDCLQTGRKESEQVKKLVNDRCRQQFIDGLITYNDWRAQIHESAKPGDIFNKTMFEMTPEERDTINSVLGGSSPAPVAEDTDTNPKPKPDKEDGNEDEKSDADDKSE